MWFLNFVTIVLFLEIKLFIPTPFDLKKLFQILQQFLLLV